MPFKMCWCRLNLKIRQNVRITDIIQRFLVSNTIKLGVISAVIAGAVVILALSHVVVITVVAAVITGVALLALGLHIVVNKKKMMYELH